MNGTFVQHNSGTEGPHHDPYHYDEYTINRDGRELVIHLGLLTFGKMNGKVFSRNYPTVINAVERFAGCTFSSLLRAMNKLEHPKKCKHCGSRKFKYWSGYAEDFTACAKCDEILAVDFDLGRVM